jgi:hypothetical protein
MSKQQKQETESIDTRVDGRPPIEHVAWVMKHIAEHLREGGSYRYLIYDRMGFGPEAYLPLYEAGGLEISNACTENLRNHWYKVEK